VVLAASAALWGLAPLFGWWLPPNVCSFGPEVDRLFYLILIFTAFFFFLVEGLLVYAMWAFPAKPGHKGDFVHGSHKLELLWTIVPALILLFIAFAQIQAWGEIKYQSRMPVPDQFFEVSARQFEWRFRYPTAEKLAAITAEWKKNNAEPEVARRWDTTPEFDDVHVVDEVHTWKGAKVRFNLKTRDVIHSFFLPNMRIKQDALPGKVIPVWFDAEESNTAYNESTHEWEIDKSKEWELACAELCGWGHYKMRGKVWVHKDKADYERWLKQASAEERSTQPAQSGQ
jgi:cytochrome c oxidase subunit 2